MADNKREAETENGDCVHEAKKAKIEEINGENDTEKCAKISKDNGNLDETNNGDDDKVDKIVTEEKTNGATEEASDNEETEVQTESAKEAEALPKKKGPLSGELLVAGCMNWDLSGRRKIPKDGKNIGPNLWGPHRMETFKGINLRSVHSGPIAAHNVVVSDDGEAYGFGRNDTCQLGDATAKRIDIPMLIPALSGINVVSAACGKGHTLILSAAGSVFAMGDNKLCQLGLGHQQPTVSTPAQIKQTGPPICRIACGAEFSVIVDIKGNLYSFGCPEYGQLGHNSDGKYFITSTKQTFNCETSPRRVGLYIEKLRDGRVNPVIDVEVKEVCCGPNHTVILDQKRRVYSWGFGGYGRLGHNEPKDEMVPRQIKVLDGRNIVDVKAGSSFAIAHTEPGVLYFWGLNKPTGEATMYPKPVQDLTGWKVRSMGASHRSIVVAADESLVSWGPSPTYGELCYGDTKAKSSTVAQEVKPLANIHIHKVGCGIAHTLLIARNDTDEDREKLDNLPVYK